jgi:hypothetical protein
VSLTDATSSTPSLVRAMDVQGTWLYIGGRFNRVSGGLTDPQNNVVVGRVARVRLSDGRPDTAWKPNFNGSIIELDASNQNDRVYVAGYFTTVNGASSPNEATISTSGNGNLVPGLGQWVPSIGSTTSSRYQQTIKEGDNGYVWQGGAQHILEQFDRATYTMRNAFITKQGGDFQTSAIIDGVLYSSCHCNNYAYSGSTNYSNPVPGAADVHNIKYIGAWDATTGAYLPDFYPSALEGRIPIGAWELTEDTNQCMWFGGDFRQGTFRNGAYQWLGGFGKFCQNDHTAPSVPQNVTATSGASGITVHWLAASDTGGGTVTYEVLSGDRVIGTTTGTSLVDAEPNSPATYWVRAMDAAHNRSSTSASATAGI